MIERGCKIQWWFVALASPVVDRAKPYGRAGGAVEDDSRALGWMVCTIDPVRHDMSMEKELEDFRVHKQHISVLTLFEQALPCRSQVGFHRLVVVIFDDFLEVIFCRLGIAKSM